MEAEKKESVSNEQKQEGSESSEKQDAQPSFDISLETSKINERLDIIVQRLTQLESKGSNVISNDSKSDDKEWKW